MHKDFSIWTFLVCFCSVLFNSGIAEAKDQHQVFDPISVYVSITNFHPSEPVRCQFVLAHFVTYDPPILSSGETLVTSISLEQDSSTLFLVHTDKPMAIEDLFCALDSDWSDTRLELSLTPLQNAAKTHLAFLKKKPSE